MNGISKSGIKAVFEILVPRGAVCPAFIIALWNALTRPFSACHSAINSGLPVTAYSDAILIESDVTIIAKACPNMPGYGFLSLGFITACGVVFNDSVSRLNSILGVRREGIRARLAPVEAANFRSFSVMFSSISAEITYRRLSPPNSTAMHGAGRLVHFRSNAVAASAILASVNRCSDPMLLITLGPRVGSCWGAIKISKYRGGRRGS